MVHGGHYRIENDGEKDGQNITPENPFHKDRVIEAAMPEISTARRDFRKSLSIGDIAKGLLVPGMTYTKFHRPWNKVKASIGDYQTQNFFVSNWLPVEGVKLAGYAVGIGYLAHQVGNYINNFL
jgi:hypothetical protein